MHEDSYPGVSEQQQGQGPGLQLRRNTNLEVSTPCVQGWQRGHSGHCAAYPWLQHTPGHQALSGTVKLPEGGPCMVRSQRRPSFHFSES